MKTKTQYLKTRLTREEYQRLAACADAAGLRLSEYVRAVLTAERQALGVDELLARLDARLQTPAANPTPAADLEALVVEVLLLTRELAQDRNAQLIARANQKLNTLYPIRRKL